MEMHPAWSSHLKAWYSAIRTIYRTSLHHLVWNCQLHTAVYSCYPVYGSTLKLQLSCGCVITCCIQTNLRNIQEDAAAADVGSFLTRAAVSLCNAALFCN